ncbi:hypothetical protein C8Q76DRAFT_402889 [Earliella scabrosa]|nr:hypothetical protein C8Q76DRAFT_402889 [Earliella scabrosa]
MGPTQVLGHTVGVSLHSVYKALQVLHCRASTAPRSLFWLILPFDSSCDTNPIRSHLNTSMTILNLSNAAVELIACDLKGEDPADVVQHIKAANIEIKISKLKVRSPLQKNGTEKLVVLPAAQPLFRWDTTLPADVFNSGFKLTASITDAPSSNPGNLLTHLDPNSTLDPVFVATVQRYRKKGKLVRWRPSLESKPNETMFEYEILAHGGIDVHATLGTWDTRADQHQVVFPGGIRREFVRAARQWRGNKVERIWDNPHFDNMANGDELSPPLKKLPPPIRPQLNSEGEPDVDVIFFPDEVSQDEVPHRSLMQEAGEVVSDDPYDGADDGEYYVDEDDSIPVDPGKPTDKPSSPTPAVKIFVKRGHTSTAAFIDPLDTSHAYFFCANRFVWIPSPAQQAGSSEPSKPILGNWPSLVAARRGNIDAVLPDATDPQRLYIFYSNLCATIRITAGKPRGSLVHATATIRSMWSSIAEAGFKTIDAVLPIRIEGAFSQAYIFSGTQFIRIRNKSDNTQQQDDLIDPPKLIVDGWPALASAGFQYVDTLLQDLEDEKRVYFFCGDYYVLASAEPDTRDYIEPKMLVTEGWPFLVKAGFW